MVDINSMKTTVIEYYPPDYSVESPILILAAPDEALVGPVCGEVVFINQRSEDQAFNCLHVYIVLVRLNTEVRGHDIVGYSQISIFLGKQIFS